MENYEKSTKIQSCIKIYENCINMNLFLLQFDITKFWNFYSFVRLFLMNFKRKILVNCIVSPHDKSQS